jgi:hypothetical protein
MIPLIRSSRISYHAKKKIPYNFEDSPHHLHNQLIPPELPWDAFAALVKQRATLAAKRHRVNNLQEFATAQQQQQLVDIDRKIDTLPL